MYKTVTQLLSAQEAHEISEVIKKTPPNNGDGQVLNSYSYYNLPICNILLGKLNSIVSEHFGKNLIPTYSYCRIYFKGAVLPPHKDRESCEYSVTMNLSQTQPWPIYMGDEEILQNPGDAVLYKGCEIEHSRKVFEGDEYIQVFLHYVDKNGINCKYAYDKRSEYIFRFNTQSNTNYINYYRFVSAIPISVIDSLIKKIECEKLENALVDEGILNIQKRITKIYWISKNHEFKNLYDTICKFIVHCNNEFYQFKLSEMIDNIQYSVYSSEDSGFYEWHVDLGTQVMRKLTCVVQLSDPSEYEGGELQINIGKIVTVEKEKGTVIIFPSYLLHRVTPVTRGIRRSLVCWVEGPTFV